MKTYIHIIIVVDDQNESNRKYAILSKLGIKSPLAFVRHAARLGLVDISDEGE